MTAVERSIVVPRHARYYTVGDLESSTELWVLLHGYGQLAREFLASAAMLESPDRLLVAPEALSRFYGKGFFESPGASWMTKEFRQEEIADYVGYLDAVVAEVRGESGLPVTVLGFSQGAATASRWCAMGQTTVRRFICWAGDVAHDIEDPRTALADIELTMVFGTRDQFITPELRDAVLERVQGLAFDVLTFDGGHRLDDVTLRKVAV